MSYLVKVTFTSTDGPDISLSDIIDPEDWSCANYWDDIGDSFSSLINYFEVKIRKVFPNGHNYILSNVDCLALECDVV